MGEGSQRSGTMNVDGARLRYVVKGSGIPVLVIGSATYYQRTFSHRLEESLQMAFIDVRHFAETDESLDLDAISLDTYVEDIERVRDHLGLDRAVIVGHSHHGNLALEYAKRYTARASHVVLIGSPPLDVDSTAQASENYWEHHASEGRRAILENNLSTVRAEGLGQLSPSHAFVTQYVAEGPKYWRDATYDASHLWQGVPINMDVIKVFRGFFASGYKLHWNPEQLRAPVLVVMGRSDYAVPPTLWDEARPALNNLTFHLFERSGHTPQLEEPELFDRVLLQWLETAPSFPAGTPGTP